MPSGRAKTVKIGVDRTFPLGLSLRCFSFGSSTKLIRKYPSSESAAKHIASLSPSPWRKSKPSVVYSLERDGFDRCLIRFLELKCSQPAEQTLLMARDVRYGVRYGPVEMECSLSTEKRTYRRHRFGGEKILLKLSRFTGFYLN